MFQNASAAFVPNCPHHRLAHGGVNHARLSVHCLPFDGAAEYGMQVLPDSVQQLTHVSQAAADEPYRLVHGSDVHVPAARFLPDLPKHSRRDYELTLTRIDLPNAGCLFNNNLVPFSPN